MGRLKATWTPTQRQCCRILKDLDYKIVRHSGDHAVFRKGSEGRSITIPQGHPTRKVSPVVWRDVKSVMD